ncbi:MAG: NYN domain-containing protein [Clostridia bacterium]|nr:NYN domain-containing protein [Clostridia bacterium]
MDNSQTVSLYDRHIAVLIDADNVSDRYIQPLLDEVARSGIITYKRIYGDWTKPSLNSWKNVLLDHSITPIQQYGYTIGKNATDSAMIIDAMDILYGGQVEGFCIVSSDSDFTRLAARLRESGMFVLGMGERKTPKPFIAACTQFKYLEVLHASGSEEPREPEAGPVPAPQKNGADKAALRALRRDLFTIVAETSDDDGWAPLSAVGNLLNKRRPDFDTRNYGERKLSTLIIKLNAFDLQHRETEYPGVKQIYIRRR